MVRLTCLRLVGIVGVVIGVFALVLSVYLFLKEATMISLTRDIVGIALSKHPPDKELLMDWIDTLSAAWSRSLLAMLFLGLVILVLSALTLYEEAELSKRLKP